MKTLIKGEYWIEYNPKEIRLYCREIEDHTNVQEEFKRNQVEYFTYSLRGQKTEKVVMKTACFITAEEVKSELCKISKMNPQEINVIKMKASTSRSLSFLINTSNNNDIRKMRSIEEIDHQNQLAALQQKETNH
ncbi:hypothetical protein WA026_019519 [Henosepilachna vigintioctopunctata]|uniref:Uncharacterized protein n=1 Tax=Henosepilachna vigintioctopunctata TaxID=420089 RepID=A0AAW1TQY3_9CUCU